jgi:phosphopantetheinyl transferase
MNADDGKGWEIRRNGGSAPNLYRAGEASELSASVAHSGHWVAAGLASGGFLGVDIEVLSYRQRQREIARLLRLDPVAEGDLQYFYSCWALREALAKASKGSLLAPHLAEFDLTLACTAPGQLVHVGAYSATVECIRPDAILAVVLASNTPVSKCA